MVFGEELHGKPIKPNALKLKSHELDAALVVGGPAPFHPLEGKRTLDLVDEWNDLTDLPYVHAFWLGRRDSLTPSNLYLLNQSIPFPMNGYPSSLNFTLDDENIESLSELYRYAFYSNY